MQRILYYIFIYNILFEGFFEGKKHPPTSLRRGENVVSLSDAEDERRETAGKQPKEGIPPEVNSKECRIVSGETTKKENPHKMRGKWTERREKRMKGKKIEQFGTEFVV